MRSIFVLFLALWVGSAAAQSSVRVVAGDWGAASVQDIEAVLESVAGVLLPDFPQRRQTRIVVRPSVVGPRVLAVKSASGEHQVLLNVRDARWDQFAYQFAHELCHIVSNYDRRPVGDGREHQWFEETVCEAVSIVALQRLAVRWQNAAPHAQWSAYAPAFGEYAARVMTEQRALPAGTSLAAWYDEHAAQVESNPYLRQENKVVAFRLVALFQAEGLQAVGYLNEERHAAAGLDGYLAAWYECCPQAHRALVRRVIALLRA